MSTFTVHCRCGEPFHADDAAIGRHVVCRRCGNVTEIQRPAAAEPLKARAPRRRKKRRDQARSATPSRQPVLVPRTGLARVVSWIVWAYLVAVVVIAAAMWTVGDRAIVGSVLLFMGRWVFLLPLALLLPAALWLRRDRLLHLVLAAAIVVGPVMGFRTGWRRVLPHPAGLPVRVATFNAEGGGVLAQMLPGQLDRWDAQIVAFQECGEILAAATARLSGWYHYEGKDLCLISKYPIRRAEVMDRSGLDRVKQSESKEIGGAGYVVRFVLDGPRGPIRVGNLHLETPRKGFEGLMERDLRRIRMNTEIREVESDLARAWVDTGTGPLVVLGDFNTPVESRIFRDHWGDLADAFSTAGFGLGMTKYNGWIRARIDHVLTSGDWHVARARVGPDAFSDHRPLLVDLTLLGSRGADSLHVQAGQTR